MYDAERRVAIKVSPQKDESDDRHCLQSRHSNSKNRFLSNVSVLSEIQGTTSHSVFKEVNAITPAKEESAACSETSSHPPSDVEKPRTSVLMELTDRLGVLHDVLRYFWKYDVNICRIESRPKYDGTTSKKKFDFFVDMEGSLEHDESIRKALHALQESSYVDRILILDEKVVRWFPRHVAELDLIANRVLDAGTDLQADHPGFLDQGYRSRRAELAKHALEYTMDKPIPFIKYTDAEKSVWTAVWDRMETLWEQYACEEYLQALRQMQIHCGYSRLNIPQQQDISEYLESRTGFRVRPVAGLLSSRDFLNALAFRVFCSTQYIRHGSKPLYTPEPDIVHELLGHAPMLADRDFADFSQQIGLASLGASDDEVTKLARVRFNLLISQSGRCLTNVR